MTEPQTPNPLPGLLQAWKAAFDREVADPMSDVSPWFSEDLAVAELEIIENPNCTELERRAAEASLASRVGLHAAHKDRQLAKGLDTTNQRIFWLTFVLAVIGALQILATLLTGD